MVYKFNFDFNLNYEVEKFDHITIDSDYLIYDSETGEVINLDDNCNIIWMNDVALNIKGGFIIAFDYQYGIQRLQDIFSKIFLLNFIFTLL